ncbi:MAG: NADH:ubiquinone oxidoreductase subunit NDUFA12 [Hyphomonadaceae bacterium]|nr:NADH:ubiquinone oxidoreductase subunit NDUFA12 [Hyphomonadaceae bacterium]MBC6412007.1 NADH:ubiquinone oxidoreductase subunit NDUFA12 [Hyphomonadaceae bacterium]
MFTFIKRIFSWWNGATLGTLFDIWKRGEKIGEDACGNIYYQEKGDKGYEGRQRRWVVYKGYADASLVPSEWHGWLHYTFDEPPTKKPFRTHDWEKEHHPNLTGTVYAYKPKGSLDRGGERDRVTGDYEAWSPEG